MLYILAKYSFSTPYSVTNYNNPASLACMPYIISSCNILLTVYQSSRGQSHSPLSPPRLLRSSLRFSCLTGSFFYFLVDYDTYIAFQSGSSFSRRACLLWPSLSSSVSWDSSLVVTLAFTPEFCMRECTLSRGLRLLIIPSISVAKFGPLGPYVTCWLVFQTSADIMITGMKSSFLGSLV